MWIVFGEKLINFRYVNMIYKDVRDDRIHLSVTGTHGLVALESFTCVEELEERMSDLQLILIN